MCQYIFKPTSCFAMAAVAMPLASVMIASLILKFATVSLVSSAVKKSTI